jgi:hypothetical protein
MPGGFGLFLFFRPESPAAGCLCEIGQTPGPLPGFFDHINALSRYRFILLLLRRVQTHPLRNTATFFALHAECLRPARGLEFRVTLCKKGFEPPRMPLHGNRRAHKARIDFSPGAVYNEMYYFLGN